MKAQRNSPVRAVQILPAVWVLAAGLLTLTSCSSLNSHGGTPVVTLLASVSFGSVPQGITSPPMTVTLMNTGTAALTFSSNPTITGTNAADFAITATTCSTASPVAVNGTCSVTITFRPSTTVAESASLTFADNAPNNPQSVSLMGTGTAPAPVVSLAPSSVAFGLVAVGVTSPPMTVTLMNTGTASLTFTSAPALAGTNAADFAITAITCSTASPVAVNGSCTVTLTFTPSTTAAESASLTFADNAANSPQSVSLTGGTSTTNNVVAAQVNLGPPGVSAANTLFVSVTICVPGSTTMCQTIPEVEVDTGSSGLRLLSSVVTLSLPQAVNGSGNPIGNCVQFADLSFGWGPVQTADIQLAGEKAASQAIQIINKPGFPAVPAGCMVAGGMNITTVSALGANGILGVGQFKQDCGAACVTAPPPSNAYFSCVGTVCSPTTMPLLSQLQNPVWMFPQDNNGVLIVLPTVGATGATVLNGSLIFGIGTQSNNMVGTAKIYTTDPMTGDFTANFMGINYPGSFVDSGSNGFFFLTTTLTSLPACTTSTGFYCPASTTMFTVTNTGLNGTSAQVMFSIANADTLFMANPSFSAFGNLGGPFPTAFDYGLPFFMGRPVFTAIEGQPAAGTTGPFFAF